MSDVVYRVIEHDGGWAYQFDGVFSETFPSRAEAQSAATRVAAEQRLPGETEAIEWQDEKGEWHEELEDGDDRPATSVETLSPGSVPARPRSAGSSLPGLMLAAGVAGLVIALAARGRPRS